MHPDLTPERLVSAYAAGIFPMADDTEDIHWLAPDPRAIIELEELKISRSLRAVVRRGDLTMTIDRAFRETMAACANRAEGFEDGSSSQETLDREPKILVSSE